MAKWYWPVLFMVKLIRQESRWIIIRRKYKPEDLFIIFRPEVPALLYNRSDSICYSIQFVLQKHYLWVQASQTVS